MFKRKAFTLIELLVVIAIIGILSGLIIVSMSGSTAKARVAKTQVYNNTLRTALMGNFEGEWSLDATPNDTWNNVTGTASGTPTSATDCAMNTCYTFNGSSQYITTPNTGSQYNIGTSGMTAMVWVKGASQVGKTFFANWDTNATYKEAWKIYSAANGTSLRVALADTTTQTNQKDYSAAAAGVALDSTWHLVGFTWSGGGGTLTLYIDGVALADGTLTKNTDLAVANIAANAAGCISIACDMANNAAANYFTGSIDDPRLFNAAIPTSQIKELYYAGLNNLFASGKISAEEYSQKISDIGLNK
jgi:prepilin-type N-terminal cleavage/methylation domain-containing protein